MEHVHHREEKVSTILVGFRLEPPAGDVLPVFPRCRKRLENLKRPFHYAVELKNDLSFAGRATSRGSSRRQT
jgi:hypothetical protein